MSNRTQRSTQSVAGAGCRDFTIKVWAVRAPKGARDVLTAKIIAVAGEAILPGDDRFWILGDPLVVEVGEDRIEIPVGFTTDGASVPGWAQRITRWKPWEGPQRWAGIVHDWLYSQPGVSKRHADDAFRAVLRSEGAGWLRRELM